MSFLYSLPSRDEMWFFTPGVSWPIWSRRMGFVMAWWVAPWQFFGNCCKCHGAWLGGQVFPMVQKVRLSLKLSWTWKNRKKRSQGTLDSTRRVEWWPWPPILTQRSKNMPWQQSLGEPLHPHGAKDVRNMDGRSYTELQLQLSLELGVQMLKRPFKGFDLLRAYHDPRRRHCRPKLRSCQLSRPKQTSIQRHPSLVKRQFFWPLTFIYTPSSSYHFRCKMHSLHF